MWPFDQIMQLADDQALDTMVASWYSKGAYEEIVESWSVSELRQVCTKLGLAVHKGNGCSAKMRAAIKAAIKKHAADNPQPISESSDEDDGEGEGEPRKGHSRSRARASSKRDDAPRSSRAAAGDRAAAASSVPSADVLAMIARLPSSPPAVRGSPSGSQRVRKGAARASPPASGRHLLSDEDSDSDGALGPDHDDSSDSDAGSHLGGPPGGLPSAAAVYASRHSRSRAVDDGMESNGLARPMAKDFIRNVLSQAGSSGSVYKVYKYDVTFHKDRNHRECLSLARVLDAVVHKQWKEVRELVCRRLAGVHAADTSDNWAMCDAFELVMDKQSFVPDSFMQRAVKNVMRMQALDKSTKGNKPHASGGKPSSGHGRPKGANSKGRERDDPPPGAPSTSRKKTTAAGKGGSAT